ncbi:MAG TPA: hypothetical protein DEG70_10355, partial [Chloroflexi bacterium]|nr:hypothetical protein [Chloroflexota bacterium]
MRRRLKLQHGSRVAVQFDEERGGSRIRPESWESTWTSKRASITSSNDIDRRSSPLPNNSNDRDVAGT